MIHKQYCKTLEHVCRRIILSFLFLFCFSELSFFWRNSSTFQFIFSHALTSSLLTCVFRVICMCDACGGKEKPMRPSEWERHTGCRKKKWKESIRVKNPDQPLVSWLQQMLGAGAIGLAYELPDIIVPAKQREQALLSVLDGETRNPEPAAECHLYLKVFKLFFCSFQIICQEINGWHGSAKWVAFGRSSKRSLAESSMNVVTVS
jgi:hypothetical protein